MKNIHYCLAVLMTATVLATADTGEVPVTLVENGEARATIVVSAKPAKSVCWAAGELQRHIKLITGAELPVVRDPAVTSQAIDGVVIYIGSSSESEAQGLKWNSFAPQEFAVQFRENAIFLMGSDDYGSRLKADEPLRLDEAPESIWGELGSLYATYEFLEKFCGVRWFMPGDLGTVYSPAESLSVSPSDIRRTLSFEDRRAPFGTQYKGWGEVESSNEDVKRFQLRLKIGGRGNIMGHTFEGFFDRFRKQNPERPQIFEGERPDYFSKKSDTAHQMCYSSTGLIAQVVKDAREFFDGKGMKYRSEGGSDWYGIGPCDTMDWCTCEGCKALLVENDPALGFANRRASALVWSFASEVAREIAKTHPDKNIACYAYADYTAFPEGVNFAENMYVVPAMFTRSWVGGNRPESAMYDAWQKQFPGRLMSMWIYPCFPVETATSQGFNCYPCFEGHEMSKNFKRFAADKMKGFMVCGSYELVEYWLYGKLTDDANQDVDVLLDEFFSRFYGAAALPMKELYLDLEANWWDAANYPEGKQVTSEAISWDNLGTSERMTRWQGWVDRASALAATDAEKARVALFRDGIWKYMVDGKAKWEHRKKYQAEVEQAKASLPPSFDVARIADAANDPAKVDWSTVKAEAINRSVSGYPTKDKVVELKLAHDGTSLYLRMNDPCDTASLEDYDCDWWGDHWEIFLAAQRDTKAGEDLAARDRGEWGPYRQLGIRESGKLARWTCNATDWPVWEKANLKLITEKQPANWIVMLAIPLAEFSEKGPVKPGESVYMNLIRGVRHEAGETLALSPTYRPGAFHNVPRLAELKLAE